MTTQIRDTQFGHLVRVLSGKKLLQYADEIELNLRGYSPGQHTESLSLQSREKAHRPAPGDADFPDSSNTEDSDAQDVHSQEQTRDRFQKDNENIRLVDWYGPEDQENPQNWSSGWKLLVTFQICLVNFSVYMASSIYVPGELSIVKDFGTGETVATLGLSLFTVGYGLGPMLWSPMSEIPTIGRTSIYVSTLAAYVLFQVPTGFAVNMPMFLVFRLLTGFFGSPSLATGGATIADMYDPAVVGYAICIWGFAGVCGPVLGPILGGIVAPVKGWQWTIWIVTWLCSFVVGMLFFLLPETSAANILYRRAKRLRKITGDDRFKSQSEIDAADHTTRDHLIVLSRAFILTFSEPIVFSMDLYTALLYGILFTWFESFPLVFGDIYGFDSAQQGLAFLGIFAGGVIIVPIFLIWVRYGIVPRFNQPTFKPEMVLPPTFVGSVFLPICLFWYGWSARESIHWIMPIVGSSFFTIGIVTLFNSILNYLGIAYPHYAASIFAGNALFRASFGAIFPLFARQLFRRLGIGPGNSLLGGIAICFIPLPYIFYKYGGKIRHMSKNARHDV